MGRKRCRMDGRQFALFRVALGLFLATHFFWLAPFAGEIYGPTGMYASVIRSPFPNALSLVPTDSGMVGVAGVVGGSASSRCCSLRAFSAAASRSRSGTAGPV
jgi:hypothetical protein